MLPTKHIPPLSFTSDQFPNSICLNLWKSFYSYYLSIHKSIWALVTVRVHFFTILLCNISLMLIEKKHIPYYCNPLSKLQVSVPQFIPPECSTLLTSPVSPREAMLFEAHRWGLLIFPVSHQAAFPPASPGVFPLLCGNPFKPSCYLGPSPVWGGEFPARQTAQAPWLAPLAQACWSLHGLYSSLDLNRWWGEMKR